ncbi:MAG: VCBS repeat-containing protein [Acidobacteriales bacterium]|nr:VCBS repeat-containing protein [Terriglobales bacterium]
MVSTTGCCALLFGFLSCSTAFAAGFKLKSVFPADSGVRSVALADLNHDGNLDLAVARGENALAFVG